MDWEFWVGMSLMYFVLYLVRGISPERKGRSREPKRQHMLSSQLGNALTWRSVRVLARSVLTREKTQVNPISMLRAYGSISTEGVVYSK